MATYSEDYLLRLRLAVEEFEAAFEAWMGTQVEATHLEARGLFPTTSPRADADPKEVSRLELDVAEKAGTAARAVSVTGAYIGIAGLGTIDPIANWFVMSSPKAPISPQEVRLTAATVKGRLDSLLADARAAQASDLPGFAPSQLHEIVWAAAAAHWTTHHYRVAVREAAEALTLHWRTKLNRMDIDGTPFWQQVLAGGPAKPGQPKLRWPGEDEDRTVKSMRTGLQPFAVGLKELATGTQLVVRNPATHSQIELSEQDGLERLATLSFLARMLDLCLIEKAEDSDGGKLSG